MIIHDVYPITSLSPSWVAPTGALQPTHCRPKTPSQLATASAPPRCAAVTAETFRGVPQSSPWL